MKLGIIGLPQSGKTTVFNALTRGDRPVTMSGGRFEVHTAVVDPHIRRNAVETQCAQQLIGILDRTLPGEDTHAPYHSIQVKIRETRPAHFGPEALQRRRGLRLVAQIGHFRSESGFCRRPPPRPKVP